MDYKISELVELTHVPKSTILYYIKEGLLPEAQKLKSNVHRYSEEHVELIKYIKYMQQEMGSSIEQIKGILQHKNQSMASSFSMLAPLMETLSGIPATAKHYTKQEFIDYFDVEAVLLEQLLEDNILVPTNTDDFTDKEASIIRLIEDYIEIGLDYTLLKTYVNQAKAMADLECQLQKQLCKRRTDENFSTLWKIMFETLFNAKSYLFSRYTHKELMEVLQEEIREKKD
ncbi:MAG: MerR family transcriptional regulator [Sulfuricurvum sp.]|uniref:MerR family transcriptional regulator n=1 Tax=Sulfuricurvum sp. TaxID=2025608 RepID=UPI0026237C9E|nr:MerR family transcriptional regulator [Sulfuricurvum sp.]MDD5158686.1 MerR family transcriptional regulator [Sulfuricurvum sp.]MDD5160248.1 MerR family transcriptional regulator [Sulfuricurvum sp.]